MLKKPDKTYFKQKFEPKLEVGLLYEKLACEKLLKYYGYKYTVKNTCNKKGYDIELSNDIKYEVKADILSSITKNIYIEYLQFNIPSGIQTTNAMYYIIVLPNKVSDKYILIDVLEIKLLIDMAKYKINIHPREHNNYTAGYLFDENIIINNGILI
jgi:hypothetical protein